MATTAGNYNTKIQQAYSITKQCGKLMDAVTKKGGHQICWPPPQSNYENKLDYSSTFFTFEPMRS